MENRSELRKFYLSRRENLSPTLRKEKSAIIMDKLDDFIMKSGIKTILFYVDYRTEVITRNEIVKLLQEEGFAIYVPKVSGFDIDFYRINSFDDLKEGYQGIMEPSESEDNIFTESDHDKYIVVTPGSVFDEKCHRMGYGKGFYDRFFASHQRGTKVGMAFDVQIAGKEIPVNENDYGLDCVITESRVIKKDN